MAEITTTQSFSDGDTVTATKLNNIQANASIQPEAITNRTAETTVDQANDLLLMYDASATALKKVSPSNLIKAGTASDFPITGNATIGGTLGVTGASTLTGNTSVGGTLGVTGNTSLAGTLGVTGNVSVNTNKFNVTAASGNTTIAGTLGVSGDATLSGNLSVTGNSVVKAGTAASPAIQPTGDTNTGIFFPAADTIAFSEGGTESMRIDSSGNVGIGTSSPSSKLVVSRSANDNLTRIILDNNNAGSSAQTILGLSNDGGTVAGLKLGSSTYSGTGGANGLDIFNNVSHVIMSTSGTERLRIDSSGNVGIGTTSPSSKLHISGGDDIVRLVATDPYLSFYNGSTRTGYIRVNNTSKNFSIVSEDATTPLTIYTNSTERLRIDSSGNVGVGTSSPASKLHIVSSSNASLTLESTTADAVLAIKAAGNGTGAISVDYRATNGYGTLDFVRSGVNKWRIGVNGDLSTNPAFSIYDFASGERLRITSGGNVSVGDTSEPAKIYVFQSANDECAYLKGNNASQTIPVLTVDAARNTTNNTFYAITYNNSGAGVERFRVADSGNVTNTNNSYGAISDIKIKQDIVDASSQWNDIKSLRVRKYRFKSDPSMPLQLGLVAQEAETVSAGLIEEHPDYEDVEITNEDGTITKERQATGTSTKAIKYSVLYMKAVKALQEAMERIEQLESKVATLEAA